MSQLKMRGVRGAITVEMDDPQRICAATTRLLQCMIEQNDIEVDDISSILFSVTADLRAAFPALAARQMGWVDVPMLHFVELDVAGSLAQVIRVLMHVNTSRGQREIQHVYLDGARALRPDLVKA